MIEIRQLNLQRGDKVLLQQAELTLAPRRHVGLVGRNGTGKSSLFALIRGELAADSGEVSLPKHWRIAAVAQETPALDIRALDYVLQGDGELQTLLQGLAAAEQADDGLKMAEFHAKLEEADAYTAESRAAKLLSGLG
ncbi:ATP-binding cassette domain-containing protein, partial [Conchiformibius steedae]|uniref:ATP-binding cassette domain-containing protein n=1 Tax=Conchiformibius steedae TaxID=153493 RepID=UPI0026EC62F1